MAKQRKPEAPGPPRQAVDPAFLRLHGGTSGESVAKVIIGAGMVAQSNNGVGEAVRSARLARKMSQQQLAEKAGTSQQTIFKIEAGTIAFSRALPAIAAALHIDLPLPDWLASSSRQEQRAPDAIDVLACLTAYVRAHGKREGLLDALLPPERQTEGIARAMGLIEYLSREYPADD